MRRFSLLLLVLILVTSVLLPAMALAAPTTSQPLAIDLGGRDLDWGKAKVVTEGHDVLTVTEYLKALGMRAPWLQAASAAKASKATSAAAGSTWMHGELVWLEVPALILEGSMYMPLRFMAESMGGTVRWDAKNQVVVIDFPDGTPGNPSAQPVNPVSRLQYSIITSDNDLYLIAKNPTDKPVKAVFPTGQTHDFAILDASGKEIWRDSRGKGFTQARWEDTIPAGHSRVYQSTIPGNLPGGKYTVRAYFPPAGPNPVASAKIEVPMVNEASSLTFQFSFRAAGSGFGNSYHRLVFQVLNRTSRALEIEYPSTAAYRVVVKNAGGTVVWDHSGQRWDKATRETVSAGSTRHHFIRLPDLPRGTYSAEVYFPPAGSQPVSRLGFAIP
jgi:hypothetical protein